MRTIISALDSVADTLESRGLLKLAFAVDTVSNTLVVSGTGPAGGWHHYPELVKGLARDRHALSEAETKARAALDSDPALRQKCEQLAQLVSLSPTGPWTEDVMILVRALDQLGSGSKKAAEYPSTEMLAIAILLDISSSEG